VWRQSREEGAAVMKMSVCLKPEVSLVKRNHIEWNGVRTIDRAGGAISRDEVYLSFVWRTI
jgi:hypothetical protein